MSPHPSPATLAAVAIALLASAPATSQRVPDIRLDSTGAFPGAGSAVPQVLAIGSSVYVVWKDEGNPNGDLFFQRSTDHGATWLPSEMRLGNLFGPSSDGPDLAGFGSSLYVVWRQGARDVYCNRSVDAGTSWLGAPPRVNHTPSGAARCPRVTPSGVDDSVYAIWEDDRNYPPGAANPHDLWFNRSRDGGLTWSATDRRLNTAPAVAGDVKDSRVASFGSGVFAVWADGRSGGGTYDIYFDRSVDGGTTWLPANVRLNRTALGTADASEPQLAFSSSTAFAINAVYTDLRHGPSHVFFNRSTDNGATWLASDVQLSNAPGSSPQIAASGSTLYVTWAGAANAIYLTQSQDGESWTAPIRLDNDPTGAAPSLRPRIAAARSSVYVVWEDTRNGRRDVYGTWSQDGGATWLASDVRLDTGAAPGSSESRAPALAVVDEHVYAVWEDERNAASDVYFNIPFGGLSYGSNTAGSAGVAPRLDLAGVATLRFPIRLDVSEGLGGAMGAMLIGVGPGSKAAVPVFGGTVLVTPALAVPLTLAGAAGAPGAGTGYVPLFIPDDPSLVGLNLNAQGLLLDPGAPFGVSMTNGLEVWIG